MAGSILNLGEAILKLEVDRSGFKSSIDTAKQDAIGLQEAMSRRSTSPFAAYIADIRQLEQAFTSGSLRADQYAQGLERSFQRMQRTIGGTREAAENLARTAAPQTPLTPAELRDMRMAENQRLFQMGARGEDGGISTDEFRARRRQINEQYREELAQLPETLRAAAAAEEDFARRMAFAEPIIERNKTALQQYLEKLERLRAARSQGDITVDEFRGEVGRARADFQTAQANDPATVARQQQLNAAKQASIALDQRGTNVTLQFASAQERHNARMVEYEHLLQRGRITQEIFNRAQRESLDIQRMEAMSQRGGLGGRVGNSLLMQGSFAVQDFATVLSMKGMGLGDALRGASNNIGMIAMMIGGPSGSLVAALATVAAVAPAFWDKFGSGAESAKERVAAGIKAMQQEFRKLNEGFDADVEQRARKRRNARMDDPADMLTELERLKVEREEAREERRVKEPALRILEADIKKFEAEEAAVNAGELDKDLSGVKEEIEAKKKERDRLRDEMAASRRTEEFSGFEARRIEAAIPGAMERERQRMKSKSAEERADADRRFERDIHTQEQADEELKRQEEARERARNKRLTLQDEREIEESRPDKGRKDVLARNAAAIEEQRRQQEVAERNIGSLNKRRGGLFSSGALDRERDEELDYMDRQKRNRETINPRLARARDVQSDLENDESLIRRSRGPSPERDAAIREARQAAQERLKEIRNESPRGSFSFSDPQSFFKNIQTSLKGDDMLKAQKDTTAEIQKTNKGIESMISAIKDINTGLQ